LLFGCVEVEVTNYRPLTGIGSQGHEGAPPVPAAVPHRSVRVWLPGRTVEKRVSPGLVYDLEENDLTAESVPLRPDTIVAFRGEQFKPANNIATCGEVCVTGSLGADPLNMNFLFDRNEFNTFPPRAIADRLATFHLIVARAMS
jgi:hypothetical protein